MVMASETNQSKFVPYSVSHIPEDVIEHILSFLPLKEVSRLSLMSKRFQYSWKFCRHLSFDRTFARNKTRDEYKKSVNDFFENYTHTCADSFSLYCDASNETNLVFDWIGKAILLKVKEIELDFTLSKEKFILSYDVVNIQTLRTMKLVNCELHMPLNSNGQRHLREITFQAVRARPMMIQSIFLNCRDLRAMRLINCSSVNSFLALGKALETLVLQECCDVQSIAIGSPALRTFHYHGKITKFSPYCNLPCLSDVILDIAHPRSFRMLLHRSEVISSLAFVKTLTVTSTFLEGMETRYNGIEYRDMEFFLRKLKEFHLIVAPESFLNPFDVAIFLRKCPYIQRVFINLKKNALGSSLYWEKYGKRYFNESRILYPDLQYVRIKGFTMREPTLLMARYFLKNATRLQRLVIVKAKMHYVPECYNLECLRLGILSNAQIQVYQHNKDGSSILPEHLGDA